MQRSLRNEVDWHDDEEPSYSLPEHVAPPEIGQGPQVKLTDVAVHLTVRVNRDRKSEVVAKRFLDLIQMGEKPSYAAKKLGIPKLDKKFMNQKEFRDAVKDLIETDTLPAAVRRMMVRAGANRIFMDNIKKGGDPKLAIDAAKLIGADPEVGLNQPTLIGVPIDMGALAGMLSQLDKIPELKQLEEGEYVDGRSINQLGSTERSDGGPSTSGDSSPVGDGPDDAGGSGPADSPEVSGPEARQAVDAPGTEGTAGGGAESSPVG